jgi:hypothetical protein
VDSFDEDEQDRPALPALLEREIQGAMSQERNEDLNLVPPEEGFELYRYKNAETMRTSRWSGLYWARKKRETTRSGPSLRRGKGTLTLGACSRKKPSRDTTRRPISLRRNALE